MARFGIDAAILTDALSILPYASSFFPKLLAVVLVQRPPAIAEADALVSTERQGTCNASSENQGGKGRHESKASAGGLEKIGRAHV